MSLHSTSFTEDEKADLRSLHFSNCEWLADDEQGCEIIQPKWWVYPDWVKRYQAEKAMLVEVLASGVTDWNEFGDCFLNAVENASDDPMPKEIAMWLRVMASRIKIAKVVDDRVERPEEQ